MQTEIFSSDISWCPQVKSIFAGMWLIFYLYLKDCEQRRTKSISHHPPPQGLSRNHCSHPQTVYQEEIDLAPLACISSLERELSCISLTGSAGPVQSAVAPPMPVKPTVSCMAFCWFYFLQQLGKKWNLSVSIKYLFFKKRPRKILF